MIDRRELQDSAQKAFPREVLRPGRDASWELMATMGWLLLTLPEDAGGLGLAGEASTILHFEMGRVLSSAPLIPALVAIEVLANSSDLPDRPDWIEKATGGELVTLSMVPHSATKADTDCLEGKLSAVPDADLASHVLVVQDDLVALVALDAPGIHCTERVLWDDTRRLFDVTLTGVAVADAVILVRGDAARPIAERAQAQMLLALAADSLGAANAAFEMSVEYLKTRRQFDRPLAMFQALKHRCADLKVEMSAAEALLWARAADDRADLADVGGLKALATHVLRIVTEEAIQFHGGIGLTEEHPIHLFMKRAMLNLHLGGDADHWCHYVGASALKRLGTPVRA